MKELEGQIINLDCTLRDGGYYTNWFFSEELVKEYFEAISFAGVDVVEVGYRSNYKDGFKGPFAFTSEYFLRKVATKDNKQVEPYLININRQKLSVRLVRFIQQFLV